MENKVRLPFHLRLSFVDDDQMFSMIRMCQSCRRSHLQRRPAYDQTSVTCRFLTQLPADQDEEKKRKMLEKYISEQREVAEKVINF